MHQLNIFRGLLIESYFNKIENGIGRNKNTNVGVSGTKHYNNSIQRTKMLRNFSADHNVIIKNQIKIAMNVYISTGDNHRFVAIMALPDPPEADPFLMSKNSSKRKIRYRGIRHVFYKSCI